MPITAVDRDPNALTLTITADFPVSRQRLWDAYADPRQLEKFWGPPGWPATFSRHDFTPGGFSHYYMTGPDGEKFYPTTEGLQQVLDMGVIEGASSAINQVDALLAEG